METCQRCNEEENDRRTLWMACFYDMGELRLPFELLAVRGKVHRHTGEEPIEILPPLTRPVFEEIPDAPEHLYRFHTLRVCKGCRAEWMKAIKLWFNSENERESEDEITEGASYVRDFGATRKMTQDEIDAYKSRAR